MTDTQKNIVTDALTHADRINNYLDCDVVADAMRDLEASTADQDVLDALHYLSTSINYRQTDAMSRYFAKAYAESMTMLQHIEGRNGEALEDMKRASDAGNVIRLV